MEGYLQMKWLFTFAAGLNLLAFYLGWRRCVRPPDP
jgi:hypothetical protein